MVSLQSGDHLLASSIPPGRLLFNKPRYLGADYKVLVTDRHLQVVGDPLEHWTSLQASLRWKEPGSGQISIPAHQYVREQIRPGNRIVIVRSVWGKTNILIGGPIEQVLRERSDNGEQSGVGVMTITFADDLAWLGARLTYPNPAKSAEQQDADVFERSGVNAAAAMYEIVDRNAGPGALTERRIPGLVTAKNTSAYPPGTLNVEVKTRWEKLTDVLRQLAKSGVGDKDKYDPDSLGFTLRQEGNQIVFRVQRSNDLSGQVLFGFSMGNLQYYAFDLVAPEVTHPHVGGSTQTGAASRVKVLPTKDADNLAWGRFETFESLDGSSANVEFEAQAASALQEHGQSARLASNASDTPDQRFGVHYDVGDVVSIELETGAFISGPVQTVSIQAYPTAGEVVGVTIGSQAARYDSDYVRLLRRLNTRVGDIERVALAAMRPGTITPSTG